MNKSINKQWHPAARIKIRRYRDTNTSWVSGMEEPVYTHTETYKLFKKGFVGKHTTWIFHSNLTLEQAIADYCKFKPLIDKPFYHEGRLIEDQWERIVLLDHYLRVLNIRESVVAAELLKESGDLACCAGGGQ